MKDAEFEVQKARIQSLADKWLGPLGLLWWTVHIEYCRDYALKVNGSYSEETTAKAHVMWEYVTATLAFNMRKVADLDDDELENVFVHECCHILIHEMREWCPTQNLPSEASQAAMMHEERVVCMLTKAFLWTRKAGAGTLQFRGSLCES